MSNDHGPTWMTADPRRTEVRRQPREAVRMRSHFKRHAEGSTDVRRQRSRRRPPTSTDGHACPSIPAGGGRRSSGSGASISFDRSGSRRSPRGGRSLHGPVLFETLEYLDAAFDIEPNLGPEASDVTIRRISENLEDLLAIACIDVHAAARRRWRTRSVCPRPSANSADETTRSCTQPVLRTVERTWWPGTSSRTGTSTTARPASRSTSAFIRSGRSSEGRCSRFSRT